MTLSTVLAVHDQGHVPRDARWVKYYPSVVKNYQKSPPCFPQIWLMLYLFELRTRLADSNVKKISSKTSGASVNGQTFFFNNGLEESLGIWKVWHFSPNGKRKQRNWRNWRFRVKYREILLSHFIFVVNFAMNLMSRFYYECERMNHHSPIWILNSKYTCN